MSTDGQLTGDGSCTVTTNTGSRRPGSGPKVIYGWNEEIVD